MSVDLIRGLLLTPDDARGDASDRIEGDLAAMLAATEQTKRSPESDDLSLQILFGCAGALFERRQCQRSVSTGSMRSARIAGTAAASSPMATSNAVVAA